MKITVKRETCRVVTGEEYDAADAAQEGQADAEFLSALRGGFISKGLWWTVCAGARWCAEYTDDEGAFDKWLEEKWRDKTATEGTNK